MSIKNNLKIIRKKKGLTQKDLAEIASIEFAQISRIETGTSEPKLETIKKLALALKCSSDELIFDVNEDENVNKIRAVTSKIERLTPISRVHILRVINSYCEQELLHMKVFDDAMEDGLEMYMEHGLTQEDAAIMAHEAEVRKMYDEEEELKDLVS